MTDHDQLLNERIDARADVLDAIYRAHALVGITLSPVAKAIIHELNTEAMLMCREQARQ